MTRQNPQIRRMAAAAMLAAVYCAVGLLLMPLSFGAVQVRVSEALTLLPVLSPAAVVGLTLGCALTNAFGSPLGLVDVAVGASATLIAALMSRGLRRVRFRGLPVASSLPPVLVNALFVGAELTLLSPGGWNAGVFLATAASVGAGQVLSCCVLGLPLVWALEKKGIGRKLFGA